MRNRPIWFVRIFLRSIGRWPVVLGGSPNTRFPAGRRKVHASRVRSPILLATLLIFAPVVCFAQDAVRSTATDQEEAEAEPVIVSATRTGIPLDQSPASVSVINSEDIDQKQIERVADALREVPGLSVVQTGTPGQLTDVFTRGLPSENTQVLLDGIPINQ